MNNINGNYNLLVQMAQNRGFRRGAFVPGSQVATRRPAETASQANETKVPQEKQYRVKESKWHCSTCGVYCNSESQFKNHIISDKHNQKVNGDQKTGDNENKAESKEKIEEASNSEEKEAKGDEKTLHDNKKALECSIDVEKYLMPEDKKVGKLAKFGFYCKVCSVPMTGEIQLIMHVKGQKHAALSPNEIPDMNEPKKKTDMFKRKKNTVNNLLGGGVQTSNNFQIGMGSFVDSPINNNQYHQLFQTPQRGQQQLMYTNFAQHISPQSANTTFSDGSTPTHISENILAVLKSTESTPIRRKQCQRQHFTNETVQMNAQILNTSGSFVLNNSGIIAIPIQNCPTPGNLIYTNNGPYAFQPIYQQVPMAPYHPVAHVQGYYPPRN
jgi:hypothetical protein